MARQLTWLPPDGAGLVLTDRAAGYRVLAAGTRGLSAPPYRLSTEQYAGVAGTRLQALEADQREISLGVKVEASSPAEFRARWRALVHAFRPRAGDGQLVVADEVGVRRLITCRYTGGLEGAAVDEFTGVAGRAIVKLAAFDPWFYGEPVSIDFGLAAPSVFLSAALPFPRMLSASTIQGQRDIDLAAADVESYPLWTITGPGSSLTLTNDSTGRTIQVDAAIADGQTVVIDTRPGHQSVRRGDGTNLMGALSSDPSLWPLVERVNRVTAVLGAAGQGSRIRATFSPRYSGV